MATTLSRITKKATSSLIPLAKRTTIHRRNYTTAILSTTSKSTAISPNLFEKTSIPTHNHLCALAEKRSDYDDIVSAVESEIDRFEVFEEPRELPCWMEGYAEPARLSREYQDEEIEVIVHGPHNYWKDEDEEKDKSHLQYVYLNVTVKKKSGLVLKFNISADHADGFTVSGTLDITDYDEPFYNDLTYYGRPFFWELNENLQKAFYKYLEVRGFDYSTAKYLFDYENRRKNERYIKWLKNLKNYIAADFNPDFNSNDITRQVSRATSIPTHREFVALADKRSNADNNFLSVVESEIHCAEKKLNEFAETPNKFPFKIKYNTRICRPIILTREYQGEKIEVTFEKPYRHKPYVYNLIGSVSNKSGLTLKFDVTADAANGIKIKSFDVRNPNAPDDNYTENDRPRFSALDENLQKSFRTYLEDRGIGPSITKILDDECMVKHTHKKYTEWLNILRNFIAN